jgi:hypothetical protein
MAAMFGLLLTIAPSIWYFPNTNTVLSFLWLGWRSTPLAVWILVAGIVDILATWYRGRWSERACRMRLRGWVVIIMAQQVGFAFVEIARLLADGFKPWVYWAYIVTIVLLTTTVVVVRLIALSFGSSPRTS